MAIALSDFAKEVAKNVSFVLRDHEYANILHEGQEFKYQSEMEAAVLRAQADINSLPPFYNLPLDRFTKNNTLFQNFTKLVAANLLDSESIRQMRNESNSAETNISTGILDKADRYSQYASKLKQEALMFFTSYLKKMNIMSSFGGVVDASFISGGYPLM